MEARIHSIKRENRVVDSDRVDTGERIRPNTTCPGHRARKEMADEDANDRGHLRCYAKQGQKIRRPALGRREREVV